MTKLGTICVTLLFPVSLFAGAIEYEGSSTVGKFISDASKVYSKSPFKVNTVTESSGGEKCAVRGGCDLGGVARAVSPDVLDKGAQATLIGKDAIAVVVHEGNSVDGLSTEQLTGIFTGHWKDHELVRGRRNGPADCGVHREKGFGHAQGVPTDHLAGTRI